MPIYNVTEQGFDHVCHGDDRTCLKEQKNLPHTILRVGGEEYDRILYFVSCEQHTKEGEHSCGKAHGCTVHIECFNNNLTEAEEISPTRDEFSREQVRNVRLLYRHVLGSGGS